ncbi:MAG: hypothetical protein ACLSFZ_11095 [Frisingicoccus sp.]
MSESNKTCYRRKISWEELQQMMDENTVLSVQIKGVVNAGVIAYVQGVRGFIRLPTFHKLCRRFKRMAEQNDRC